MNDTHAAPDIADPQLYLNGIPHDRFAELRATPGLAWHPYGANGFWAVTRHDDVRLVSRNPDVFSSAIGHTNLWDLEADARKRIAVKDDTLPAIAHARVVEP